MKRKKSARVTGLVLGRVVFYANPPLYQARLVVIVCVNLFIDQGCFVYFMSGQP